MKNMIGCNDGVFWRNLASSATAIIAPRSPVAMLFPLALLMLMMPSSLVVESAVYSISPGGDEATSLQDALDVVAPGDVIELGTGQYWEDAKTMIDGTEDAPITIRGADGADAVLRGAGNARLFEVRHDFYILEDFTIDGDTREDRSSNDIGDQGMRDVYRDKLIFATAGREPTVREGGYRSALDGLIVQNMLLMNAGGECVRLRDFVSNTDFRNNNITNCGIYDFRHDDGGKNGEGVYIGTSVDQWDDGKNWSDEPDVCYGNIVRNNYIRTRGNEGIDVKEGSLDTLIASNSVYMQKDDDSGGIGSRADNSSIIDNYIENAHGAGVRLGGYLVDSYQYGTGNTVTGNVIRECQAFGVSIMVGSQSTICGNDIEIPAGVDEEDYLKTGGDASEGYDVTESCGNTASTTGPTPCSTPGPTRAPTLAPSPSPVTDSTPSPTDAFTPAPLTATDFVCEGGIPGIQASNVCCPTSCGTCGGTGCTERDGGDSFSGAQACCGTGVRALDRECSVVGEAPCVVLNDSVCEGGIPGIQASNVCCPTSCGTCGGTGCTERDGGDSFSGAQACCGGGVRSLGRECSVEGKAPCVF